MNTSLAVRRPIDPAAEAMDILDPLADDHPSDRIVVTTERAITRVALVAAEAGARFQRDAVACDPMAWMLAPRRAFSGVRPIEACLDRDACARAIVLHGLGLGLDVERCAIDELMRDDDEGEDEGCPDDAEAAYARAADHIREVPMISRIEDPDRLRLYTATIVDTRNNVMMQAFHASMAHDVREVRARLVGRFGADIAEVADIRRGIPKASPVVLALVPVAIIELIQRTAEDWTAPAARTFGVDIQHCVQA